MQSNYSVSYSEALKTVLNDFSSKNIFSADDIDRYILAFSYYLSVGDDAYRYHTGFLVQKHSSFQDFLREAKKKQERLSDFIARLISLDTHRGSPFSQTTGKTPPRPFPWDKTQGTLSFDRGNRKGGYTPSGTGRCP